MSYDPDKPQPEREPEQSGPWLPPRVERGPINPPEVYRKTRAKVKVRNVRPSRWRSADVWRRVEIPHGSIIAAERNNTHPIGTRWVGRTHCPACHTWVDMVIKQLPTAEHPWACVDCTDQYTRNLRHALTNDELFRRGMGR